MRQRSSLTRRDLLTNAAGAIAAIAACNPLLAQPATELPVNLPAVQPQLSLFNYSQVHLAPGPLQRQFDENHELLRQLNEDSLLRPFRVREGLSAPGKDLGGWYDTYAFAPGHAYGQWLSALSRYYAATQNESTRAKVSRMVRGYAATIDPAGKFYLENRFPAYIYDKLVCRLIDADKFVGDPVVPETLARATDARVLPG
jgi:uncharacterized protein